MVGVISAHFQEMEPTPNHGVYGSSKRPCLDNPPTPDTGDLRRLVASRTDSPPRLTPATLATNDVLEELNKSQDDLPLTQDQTEWRPNHVAEGFSKHPRYDKDPMPESASLCRLSARTSEFNTK